MASRPCSWNDTNLFGVALVAATPLEVDLLASAPTLDTLTVIRVIADITVQYQVDTTINDALSAVSMGIGVSSKEAFAVGGVSLPNPTNPTEYPPRGWLYVNTLPVAQLLTSATGIINEAARFQLDMRAARKIDKGTLFMTMEQNTITVGGAMQVVGRVRVLCLG